MTQEQIRSILDERSHPAYDFDPDGATEDIYKLHLQDKLEMLKEIERGKWMNTNLSVLSNCVNEITKQLMLLK
jgi:hypothetical protein